MNVSIFLNLKYLGKFYNIIPNVFVKFIQDCCSKPNYDYEDKEH